VSAATAGILGALAGLGVVLLVAGLRRAAEPEPSPRLAQLAARVRQEATMPRVAATLISMAVVAQMQAGAPVTLEIFGTTYNLTLISALEATSTVKGQQRRLSMLGYELGNIDGVFGLKTDRATLNFQADMALDPDGIIGNITKPQLTTAFGE